jgi:hypothetical protein
MEPLTEHTAQRLASALERVADVLERGGVQKIADQSHDALLADIALRGPVALVEHNKRNRVRRGAKK